MLLMRIPGGATSANVSTTGSSERSVTTSSARKSPSIGFNAVKGTKLSGRVGSPAPPRECDHISHERRCEYISFLSLGKLSVQTMYLGAKRDGESKSKRK
ncbi:hypothetical protein M438DRAFT_342155 [Aureobasidium pullulans EXF-150]|uniref:Uncharacterized protein n=1 Tax=Aureobasidium pullulans EXF-150 TaxID=1043002 RepID=A0A074XY67_AURPU|nr:uncharacterized protein M438DRAFT_342155 [Aureobasidium pullulans EXF-150]KEQ88579.1 hypothetical protein M438DRAFT_342155 [Aureobasidium pullulans EXF-150]